MVEEVVISKESVSTKVELASRRTRIIWKETQLLKGIEISDNGHLADIRLGSRKRIGLWNGTSGMWCYGGRQVGYVLREMCCPKFQQMG